MDPQKKESSRPGKNARKKEALRATRERRPDLLASASLEAEEKALIAEIDEESPAVGPAGLDKTTALLHK